MSFKDGPLHLQVTDPELLEDGGNFQDRESLTCSLLFEEERR